MMMNTDQPVMKAFTKRELTSEEIEAVSGGRLIGVLIGAAIAAVEAVVDLLIPVHGGKKGKDK